MVHFPAGWASTTSVIFTGILTKNIPGKSNCKRKIARPFTAVKEERVADMAIFYDLNEALPDRFLSYDVIKSHNS